ncbi:MAG: hypothetical protein HC850_06370 [Rhodomicrobium sp.]|nr:hypothetical protein [Rhodomicrobium sp.]
MIVRRIALPYSFGIGGSCSFPGLLDHLAINPALIVHQGFPIQRKFL